MLKSTELESAAYQFEAKMPLKHAIPLGLSMCLPCLWAT